MTLCRINIIVICLQFCKLIFWQSNFVKSLHSHDRVKTYDCGERTAGWFSTFLGRPCRLIRQSPDRKNDTQHKNTKGLLSILKKKKKNVVPLLVNMESLTSYCV